MSSSGGGDGGGYDYSEDWVVNSRGMRLFTSAWIPKESSRGVVCLCHGYAVECSVTMRGTAERLARAGYASTKKRWYLSSVKGPPCISLPRNLGATDKCDFCHRGTDQFSSSVNAKEVGGGGGEGKGGVEGEGDACVVSARAAVEGGGGNGYMRIITKEATLRVITSMMLE
uniref:Uncharacterized protein n=1 Tax=Oryza glumipatula TaxID=40148 RepID=A0A0E0BEC6_9ORYZ